MANPNGSQGNGQEQDIDRAIKNAIGGSGSGPFTSPPNYFVPRIEDSLRSIIPTGDSQIREDIANYRPPVTQEAPVDLFQEKSRQGDDAFKARLEGEGEMYKAFEDSREKARRTRGRRLFEERM